MPKYITEDIEISPLMSLIKKILMKKILINKSRIRESLV